MNGLKEIEKFLGSRGGAAGEDSARFVSYLTSIFHGHYSPEKVGVRTSREMRTLAEALDGLTRGDLPFVADLLTQRFKACELSITDGGWEMGQNLELLPEQMVGLAGVEEQRKAAKIQLLKAKLHEVRKRS